MRPYRNTGLAIGLACTWALAVPAVRSAETVKAPEVPAKTVQEMKDFLRSKLVADIDFSGTVQDTEGKPLDDVRMLVVVGDRKGKRYENHTVSRTFTLKYPDTVLCDVYFSKAGYYEEERRFNTSSGLGVTGVSKDGDALIAPEGFVVALEPIGPATPMLSFKPDCEFRITGEWRVNQLVVEKDGKRELQKSPVWHKLDMTGKGVDALPPYCPYVRADVQDGRIALAEKPLHRTTIHGTETWRPEQTPAGVYLGISGPGNGLVLFDPGPERKLQPRIEMRAMKEAPETGYTQEILLDQTQDLYGYFYLKIGDWYGKGYIVLNVKCGASDPTRLGSVLTTLWIQPDGSRNVRSMK